MAMADYYSCDVCEVTRGGPVGDTTPKEGPVSAVSLSPSDALRTAAEKAADYLDELGDNLLRNDADMRLDPCEDPTDVAEALRLALSRPPVRVSREDVARVIDECMSVEREDFEDDDGQTVRVNILSGADEAASAIIALFGQEGETR